MSQHRTEAVTSGVAARGQKRPSEPSSKGPKEKKSRSTPAEDISQTCLNKANRLIDDKQYEEAIKVLQPHSIHKNPQTVINVHYKMGEAYFKRSSTKEDLERALAAFSTAGTLGRVLLDNQSNHDPEIERQVARLYLRWANVCHLLGRAKDAIFACKQCIEICPEKHAPKVLVFALFMMGMIMKGDGKPDASAKALERCISVHQKLIQSTRDSQTELQNDSVYLQSLKALALVYMEQKRFDEAISTLKNLAAIDTTQIDVWNALGDAYVTINQMEHALSMYNVPIAMHAPRAIDAQSSRTVSMLARLHGKVGFICFLHKQYPESRQSFIKSIRAFMARPNTTAKTSDVLNMCLHLNTQFCTIGKPKLGVQFLKIAFDLVKKSRLEEQTRNDALISAKVYSAMARASLDKNYFQASIVHYETALRIFMKHCGEDNEIIQKTKDCIQQAKSKQAAHSSQGPGCTASVSRAVPSNDPSACAPGTTPTAESALRAARDVPLGKCEAKQAARCSDLPSGATLALMHQLKMPSTKDHCARAKTSIRAARSEESVQAQREAANILSVLSATNASSSA